MTALVHLSANPNIRYASVAMMYSSVSQMVAAIRPAIELAGDGLKVNDPARVRNELIDDLVYTAVFGDDDTKSAARWIIWNLGWEMGAPSCSIEELYRARGRGEYEGVTVPAFNLRGMAYDMARALVSAARAKDSGAFIFELARSEMGYTDQKCEEFATVVTAASIREGHRGPIFIQGDHFQVNAKRYAADPAAEIDGLAKVIREAVAAGYGNVDIDTSTIVDITKESVDEQQRLNYIHGAELSRVVRDVEPAGVTVSIGGEIGEVGKTNSTVDELRAYLDGFNKLWNGDPGISKVSVQTGTSHGGVVLPDGTIARVALDFGVHEALGVIAREYGLGGTVQHGASTLPPEAFGHFPKAGAIEVHLATEFQNMMFDGGFYPAELREDVHAWCRENMKADWKEGETDQQFLHKTRKNAWGPFKRQSWDLPPDAKAGMRAMLQEKFEFLMDQLGASNTTALIARHINPVRINKPQPESLRAAVAALAS
jgi:fructose/tagatose bisphosphate aldolase